MRAWMMAGLAVLTFSASPLLAQQAPAGTRVTASEPGKVAITDTVQASAAVTGIDRATRTVTLKTADGSSFDVVAGKEVRNFAQVKVGDQVQVEYVRALTMEVRKGGGVRERAEKTAAIRAEPGEKPGGAAGRRVTVLADVVDVNPGKKTITLKGPKGRVVELNVKNPDHFKVVKVGDQVEADYVEALAITMKPAATKDAKK